MTDSPTPAVPPEMPERAITPALIARLLELCAKASMAPWKKGEMHLAQTSGCWWILPFDESGKVAEVPCEEREEQGSYNADFIAESRNALEGLCREWLRMAEENERLRSIKEPTWCNWSHLNCPITHTATGDAALKGDQP